ncbi:phosphoenolpyruvate carboxykinase (GTP), partial [Streptomyces sp. SID10244]|nr:phosphoenolpyruvate carboxykinase (GTP) [Streptomyces sp. SID10244]
GDYFAHWIDLGKNADAAKLPKIFYVNWFRRGDDGRFLWPGFGENSRVLEWIVGRIEGENEGISTPIGIVAKPEEIDVDGLGDLPAEDIEAALAVNADEWRQEIPLIEELFEFVGDKLPTSLQDELDQLKQRLG